jgi:hypothetical protein
MIRRTTNEIDEELLERARRALASHDDAATGEEAFRCAAEQPEDERQRRAPSICAHF